MTFISNTHTVNYKVPGHHTKGLRFWDFVAFGRCSKWVSAFCQLLKHKFSEHFLWILILYTLSQSVHETQFLSVLVVTMPLVLIYFKHNILHKTCIFIVSKFTCIFNVSNLKYDLDCPNSCTANAWSTWTVWHVHVSILNPYKQQSSIC